MISRSPVPIHESANYSQFFLQLYKKSSANWNVSWQLAWSVSTLHSVRAAGQRPCRDGILFHSKGGEIFEISTRHDGAPRVQVLYADQVEYKALLCVSQRADHVAAIDRSDRLCMFELSTGKLTARSSLRHHGQGKDRILLLSRFFVYKKGICSLPRH